MPARSCYWLGARATPAMLPQRRIQPLSASHPHTLLRRRSHTRLESPIHLSSQLRGLGFGAVREAAKLPLVGGGMAINRQRATWAIHAVSFLGAAVVVVIGRGTASVCFPLPRPPVCSKAAILASLPAGPGVVEVGVGVDGQWRLQRCALVDCPVCRLPSAARRRLAGRRMYLVLRACVAVGTGRSGR